ncbi:MAG: RNA 2',3'-cyclic phosphodiesterase [Candidatus Cloacimonadota bacterium]|nr:RNA 2',3'-cyclic phosphodiesterase [Candidatus Cloacimonadota bacterium]
MRLFLALDFPLNVKRKIEQNINILHLEISKGVKWVETENLHVTFRFLGDAEPKILDGLNTEIEAVTKNYHHFSIAFGNIEVVPNFYRPRIIWYNMLDETGISQKVFHDVEMRLVNFGFKKEIRYFKLHTTLGRVKYVKKLDWKVILKKLKPLYDTIDCRKLTLFKSQLTSSGPIYSIVKKYDFK